MGRRKKKAARSAPRLERRWARIVLGLTAAAFLGALFSVVMYFGFQAASPLWLILGSGGALVCLVLGIVLRFRRLRCPCCRRGVAVPQWGPGRRYRCPVCHKPFLYDDEEE